MKLLAIDTSGRALSAAIAENGIVLVSGGEDTGKNHSLGLLPLVDRLLKQQGMTMRQLDGFAVTAGPGSFTGLRIGMATVKAWCQCLDKPLISVSSLDALACLAGDRGHAAPICDARRDELYTALYLDGKRLTEDRAVSPNLLLEELDKLNEPVCFSGDGLAACEQMFRSRLQERFLLPSDGNTVFMAASAAKLAWAAWQRGEFADAGKLTPVYLRLSEAEEKRLAALAQQDKEQGGTK